MAYETHPMLLHVTQSASISHGCPITYNLYLLRDKVVLNLFEFYYVACLGSNKLTPGWLSFLNSKTVSSACTCKLSTCTKKQFLQEQLKHASIKIFNKQVVTSHSKDIFLLNFKQFKNLNLSNWITQLFFRNWNLPAIMQEFCNV